MVSECYLVFLTCLANLLVHKANVELSLQLGEWLRNITLRAVSVAAAVVAAARASGGTKGLQVGTLSSSRL